VRGRPSVSRRSVVQNSAWGLRGLSMPRRRARYRPTVNRHVLIGELGLERVDSVRAGPCASFELAYLCNAAFYAPRDWARVGGLPVLRRRKSEVSVGVSA